MLCISIGLLLGDKIVKQNSILSGATLQCRSYLACSHGTEGKTRHNIRNSLHLPCKMEDLPVQSQLTNVKTYHIYFEELKNSTNNLIYDNPTLNCSDKIIIKMPMKRKHSMLFWIRVYFSWIKSIFISDKSITHQTN